MSHYTDTQLDMILQYIKEEDIDEIETMAYGGYIALTKEEVSEIMRSYKIVWLHDDPYEVHMIPLSIIYESMR